MAIMIPVVPAECTDASHEKDIFYALEEKLSKEYYVFHSYRIVNVNEDNLWKEKEIDFIIYHRKKGLICIEAKAGKITCKNGIWYYQNGDVMRNPFSQVNSAKWSIHNSIVDYFKPIVGKQKAKRMMTHIKILEAVWFCTLPRTKLKEMTLPQNADPNIILTKEDLDDPQLAIDRLFDIDTTVRIDDQDYLCVTDIPPYEEQQIFSNILCPTFNLTPSKTVELDYIHDKFHSLIKEQVNLLNYLEDQPTAVINGAAGTGKTMIAIEKARRHSARGEKVLFLCFNSRLQDHLAKTYQYPGVDYFDIHNFACRLCGSSLADFELLKLALEEECDNGTFKYDHIIIDEAQDFGQDAMLDYIDDIFALLEKLVLAKENGTFYAFYDRMQLVQGKKVPDFIENADCRLTLYKNCRNTRRIAETSFRPFRKEPKLFDSAIVGELPTISYATIGTAKKKLDAIIAKSFFDKIEDIQILSCVGDGNSIFDSFVDKDGYIYKNRRIPFTTCRKYKGLEADKIIIVDVDKASILDNSKLFYVGSSRARIELSVLAVLNDDECIEIIEGLDGIVKKTGPQKTLAKMLGCAMFDE